MPLSPPDRIRGKRDREFQARVLAALEKPRKRHALAIINSPIVIWLLSAIVITLGGGYYTAYRQCVADALQIRSIYTTYKVEITYRENAIADAVTDATTMADLHKGLELLSAKKQVYFKSDLRDQMMPELMTEYRAAYLRIDRSQVDAAAERALLSSPLNARFNTVFLGYVPPTLTDADLPDLKRYASMVSATNLISFINAVRTIYESRCAPGNVVSMALGNSPIIVRARQITFTEREKHDLRLQ